MTKKIESFMKKINNFLRSLWTKSTSTIIVIGVIVIGVIGVIGVVIVFFAFWIVKTLKMVFSAIFSLILGTLAKMVGASTEIVQLQEEIAQIQEESTQIQEEIVQLQEEIAQIQEEIEEMTQRSAKQELNRKQLIDVVRSISWSTIQSLVKKEKDAVENTQK